MPVQWSDRKTPVRKVAMDDALWDELGELAAHAGTDRSAVLRELARGWVKRQRRQLERNTRMRGELRAVTRGGPGAA